MPTPKSNGFAHQEALRVNLDDGRHHHRSVDGLWLHQRAAEARVLRDHDDLLRAEAARARADELDARADAALALDDEDQAGRLKQLAPDLLNGAHLTGRRHTPTERPDRVTVDASRHRLSLSAKAGVAAMAADAARSVRAEDSLEIMLAHQCAVAHSTALELQSRSMELLDRFCRSPNGNDALCAGSIRLMNVAARMMAVTQQSALTLNRLRTAGTQNVVVRHVLVESGGGAAVTRDVRIGGGSR